MHWVVLAPFIRKDKPEWIFQFIDEGAHSSSAVPATYEHDRSRQVSSATQWLDYFKHGWAGFRAAVRAPGRSGVVTTFPQLAVAVALYKKLTLRKDLPLIAWCFNLAQPYGGWKGALARFSLSSVDVFVVHSRSEIDIYSKWLNLPPSRFVFVPLSAEPPQREPWTDNPADPYIVALGTANRDYQVLCEAAGQLGYKTIIVAGKHATEHLAPPACVTVKSGLSLQECHQLAARSRVNVIPIADASSPSGQVTVIESMMLGVPLIATDCAGTSDYIEDGVDGVLVQPRDAVSLKAALQALWTDAGLRSRMSAQAQKSSLEKFTFRAASHQLLTLMNQFSSR
jgi:glycosyltransferase involved in cell wall biosynthesis